MERYISILGVLIAIMLIFFFAVGKYMSGNVTPQFGSCDQIEDSERRVICLKDLAMKNLDLTPCLQIEKTFDRDVCLRNVAIKMRDKSVCPQISNPDIRRICINDFA